MVVSFEELEGSPRIQIREEGTEAQRFFRIDWDDWPDFARELVGHYKVTGDAFSFIEPIEFPGFPNLIVSQLEIEPFEPSRPDGAKVITLRSGANRYLDGGARITAMYTTRFDRDNQPRAEMPQPVDGTYLTYSADLGADYMATPGRNWNWDAPPGDPKVGADVNPGLLIPQGAFQLTWRRVALPPWDTIRQLRGKVNQAQFMGAPAETVLFLGAKATREFQFVEDGGYWRIEYHFLENTKELTTGAKVGWNHFHKETSVAGEHWVAIEDADGTRPYKSGDFTQLLLLG